MNVSILIMTEIDDTITGILTSPRWSISGAVVRRTFPCVHVTQVRITAAALFEEMIILEVFIRI